MSQFELLQVSETGFVLIDLVNQEFNVLPLFGDRANIKAQGQEDFEDCLSIFRCLALFREKEHDLKRRKTSKKRVLS